MKILDVNLLIYAVNRDSPLHSKAKAWLEQISWLVILAFLRLTTEPGLFQSHYRPRELSTLGSAISRYCEDW